MSSEMREIVADMRLYGGDKLEGSRLERLATHWADQIEALLARTEAGADGAVSMNPIGYVDLASWQADWNADKSFFTDYQDEDTQPIYTQAQMEHAIEIAKATRPQDASGDVVPVLFGRDADADWYVDAGTKSICVDVDFDPARQLSLILKQDGSVAWSIFVQEPDSSTTKATGPSVMNPGFYEALSYIAMQAKEAK